VAFWEGEVASQGIKVLEIRDTLQLLENEYSDSRRGTLLGLPASFYEFPEEPTRILRYHCISQAIGQPRSKSPFHSS
jgi:hypothetical protein